MCLVKGGSLKHEGLSLVFKEARGIEKGNKAVVLITLYPMGSIPFLSIWCGNETMVKDHWEAVVTRRTPKMLESHVECYPHSDVPAVQRLTQTPSLFVLDKRLTLDLKLYNFVCVCHCWRVTLVWDIFMRLLSTNWTLLYQNHTVHTIYYYI